MPTNSMMNFYEDDFPDYFIKGENYHQKSKLMLTYPINFFSRNGCYDEVLKLISFGVDVNSAGDMGYTPLHEAAGNGFYEIVSILLANEANTSALNEFGKTAADLARENKFSKIENFINEFSKKKINDLKKIQIESGYFSEKSLHDLIRLKKIDDIRLILQNAYDVNEVEDDGWGMSPLHIAVGIGDFSIVKLLIDCGADPMQENSFGYNSIDIAFYTGSKNIMDYIYAKMKG